MKNNSLTTAMQWCQHREYQIYNSDTLYYQIYSNLGVYMHACKYAYNLAVSITSKL